MRIIRCIWFDIKNNFFYNKIFLLMVAALMILSSVYYVNASKKYVEGYNEFCKSTGDGEIIPDIKVSSADIILFMFAGMDKINEKDDKIDIPVMYIALAIIFTCLTYRYICSDLSNTVVPMYDNRILWLACKILSNIFLIISVYVVGIFVAFIAGKNTWTLNKRIDMELIGCDYCKADKKEFVLLIITSVITVIVISCIQVFMSIAVNYVIGIIVSFSIYILSLFGMDYYMIANGCMIQRSKYFMEHGYNYININVINFILLCLVLIALCFVVKRKDIL